MKIFVGKLPDLVTSDDLRKLFEEYGNVSDCDRLHDKDYGFVHMHREKDGQAAIAALNEKMFMGNRIRVEASQSKSGRTNSSDGCHNCGELGHFARECTNTGRRVIPRSRETVREWGPLESYMDAAVRRSSYDRYIEEQRKPFPELPPGFIEFLDYFRESMARRGRDRSPQRTPEELVRQFIDRDRGRLTASAAPRSTFRDYDAYRSVAEPPAVPMHPPPPLPWETTSSSLRQSAEAAAAASAAASYYEQRPTVSGYASYKY